MTPSVIESHIDALLADIAPGARIAFINRAGRLRDELDIDSMDFLRLVQGLDARTGVAIPEADYGKVDTLDGLVAYVAARTR